MADNGVGRVLVASLHQGIADILPTRLSFYEHWLNNEGLRDGTIGLAPFYAVLSFLRQEGQAYDLTTLRAGDYAAQWTVESLSSFERRAIMAAPPWLRARLMLRVARRLVRATYGGSRAVMKVRQGTAQVDLRASVFCTVRDPVAHPLCGFYAAAFTHLLELFEVPSRAAVISCRGTGEPRCTLTIPLARRIADGEAPQAS